MQKKERREKEAEKKKNSALRLHEKVKKNNSSQYPCVTVTLTEHCQA
jgi:hypothetical protein